MIRKSVKRFSEEITLKTKSQSVRLTASGRT